jgi:hypothetical protein
VSNKIESYCDEQINQIIIIKIKNIVEQNKFTFDFLRSKAISRDQSIKNTEEGTLLVETKILTKSIYISLVITFLFLSFAIVGNVGDNIVSNSASTVDEDGMENQTTRPNDPSKERLS